MNSIEYTLRERLKELTCMYEVTSIIVNSDFEKLELSLKSIAFCLKKAFQHESEAGVHISCSETTVAIGEPLTDYVRINAPIKVFNEPNGCIEIRYPSRSYTDKDFLEEEIKLLSNVCLEIGNLIERKQIREKEELIRKQMERNDRLNILGEITAGIAHELNTPLTSIIGFTELLDEQIKDELVQSDLSKIKENALFCREIVKKLMFFACEVPQQIQEILLNPVLQNVLNLLSPAFKKKDVTANLIIEQTNIGIKADEIQLTQVLFNIIMNALYYSPSKATIEVQASKDQKGIVILIKDQGPGIDQALSDKVYEPFYTTKPVGDGSGLGLSVVHGIMSSHKGSISFYPNAPHGTVFELCFPN
ncbi:sensor histidine kinase [Galbibacter marinus]|uniref:histidine kinase n=1 Tax=Galbibacter marinus TaxID=555500 RepID=K2Q6J2_9FLAO|nr:HAMP domain-containing sensor histidine kinase [Galbibacter marinus]EKF56491.1 sensor histidine kinase [Galbibacter marinus]